MKRYGQPREIVTDGLCSYSAAMKELGNADRHEVGGRLNNRAENSHQPFRRRERAMHRFRSTKTLQKFSSVHFQSGAASRHPAGLQAETLCGIGRVARSRGLMAAWAWVPLRHTRATCRYSDKASPEGGAMSPPRPAIA